jgi:hypothetical protein
VQNRIRLFKLKANPTAPRFGVPPLDVLKPLIDTASDSKGEHWLWDGDFDDVNAAMFSWVIMGKSRRFYVARVLYHYFVQPPIKGTGFINLCGAFSCVNPYHWHSRTKEEDRKAKSAIVIVDNGSALYK